nr:MAG TPA: hypothetical protein [Bacteriophage sp.]
MCLYWFTVFLCLFPTISQLWFSNFLIISFPLTSYLLLYRIHDNGLIVVNGKPKYLLITCIGGIFTSAN